MVKKNCNCRFGVFNEREKVICVVGGKGQGLVIYFYGWKIVNDYILLFSVLMFFFIVVVLKKQIVRVFY